MPLVAGPPGFVTLNNIIVGNDATNVYVRCDTDVSCQLRYRMWREKDPSVVYTETETPAAVGKRYQTLGRANLGAMDFTGEIVFVEISTPVPPNPAAGPLMRPYTGQVRITGARTVAKKNAVPVEFHGFTTSTPTSLNYTWAQYNTDQRAGAADAQIGKPWVVLSSLQAVPKTDSFTLRFHLDAQTHPFVRYWGLPTNGQADLLVAEVEGPGVGPGWVSIVCPLGPGWEGKQVGFEVYVDPGYSQRMRSQTGVVQLLGARDKTDTPVRFYTFSGSQTAPPPTPGTLGNWSNYAWSQWGLGPPAPPPITITGIEEDISNDRATIDFDVDPPDVIGGIEYGLTASYGSWAPDSGSPDPTRYCEILGLTVGTLYHYRIKCTLGGGTAYGPASTFTTDLA